MSTRLTTHAPISTTPQQSPGLLLQRKCAGCGNHTGGGGCSGCAKKEQDKLQRRAAGIETMTEIPPIVNDVLNSPGQPLDTATRAFMEPRFQHDFSQVRVHADVTAAESARAVNAHAFTVGSHIVFDASKYAPSTTTGKNLLAHELTHVLQQSHGLTRSATFGIGPANDEHEQQADAVANAIVSTPGKPVVNNTRPLIPGTQQTVARNDAPPPPPRTRLQRRSAEDELFDPFTGGESQAADGGGTTTAPEKPQCPKVPTKKGDEIPKPMCPTATHTGLSEMDRFNFCLDSDELTDPSQLGAIPAAIARTRRSARFLIHGYASPEGKKDYNFRLACHRAIKIANAFRAALRTKLGSPSLDEKMLEAEVESRIETASQGPTSEFGKAEENRVAIVFEQVADKADPEPSCKDAPRRIGDIKPEVECDAPTRDLLHMDGSPRLNQFHFCLDSDVLNGSDTSALQSFAHRQAASSTFVVHGFASFEGPPDYNQRLSCHRALRIFRELINAGVKQEQIVEVSGIGVTDRFGEPQLNRVVSVLAEGGDTGVTPPGTRKTDNRKQREAVRDEAVARIMAGKYELGADAYISFWTCGRTATVRQAVERLKIEVQDDDKTETTRQTMMGTEEGFGVNFIRLSNAALRADNSIECTMGRIIDSAFHHAAMTGDLPTTPVPDPNALPSDLTGPTSGARHQAGLHLIHLAGLSQCFGKNLEPHTSPAHKDERIGIDLPLEDDPRKGFVPFCAEAPQATRLHPPAAGAKGREVPEFELVGTPTYTPNRGKLKSNFDPKAGQEPEADPESKSGGDVITTPDKDMLTASATVQLKGQKDTFKDYEVGFIQSVIADEVQADYDSGESVIQKLPTPIRLAHMKGEPRVPAPWTSATSFARPDPEGKVSLTAGASGLNMEAAVALRRIDFQLPNSAVHSLEQGSRIAIWLIARRLGAPLDRFSVHFLHGVFYDLTQLAHLEHRRVFGELDQTKFKTLREHELAVVVGSFLSSKPSQQQENPSSARLTGAVASEIGLFNQVRDVAKARASGPTDMDKTQLRAIVIDILDNLQVFADDEKARAGKDGRRMPRLGFDFIPLTITMPFVRRTGRLLNPIKREILTTVTGPGLGFDARHAIAEALEFRIRDRASEGKDVVLRQEFIPGKGETGDVTMTLPPIPRRPGADPETDPDVTRNPKVLRSMAEAWACTLSTRGFLFQGVEFCRAFWMDREKQLRGVPEDRLVRGETKIENGGASVSECKLPCLLAEEGTTAGVRLVGFHTHPEPDPEPTEADLKHARDCGAPTNFIITDNQAFRFTKDGLVDEDPMNLPKGVTCDPKNLEGFKQPPE